MASSQISNKKFLTLVILFVVFISMVLGDLAPKEDEDEEIKPPTDLKKIDETVTTLEPPKTISNLGFIHAFIASFSVIMVSEIGDKTFFIAAIMSMVSTQIIFHFTIVICDQQKFYFVEISTSIRFLGCHRSFSPYDCIISSVRNGVHSIYSYTYNKMGLRPFVRSIWFKDVAWRLEHDSHRCSWRNGRSSARHQKERRWGKSSDKSFKKHLHDNVLLDLGLALKHSLNNLI